MRRLIALAEVERSYRHTVIVTHSNALLDELESPARQERAARSEERGSTSRSTARPLQRTSPMSLTGTYGLKVGGKNTCDQLVSRI